MGEYSMTLSLEAASVLFASRVAAVIERASFVVQQVDSATSNRGLLSDVQGPAMGIQFRARPLLEVQDEARRCALRDAMRESVEEVEHFLENVRKVYATVALIASTKSWSIPAELYLAKVEAPRDVFDSRNFPDKIQFLNKEYGPDPLPSSIDAILTLKAARNCLVHRQGIVGAKDVKVSGKLVVKWETFWLDTKDPGGRQVPLQPGVVLEGGTQILFRRKFVEREFKLGEAIAFSPTDLTNIYMTLYFFAMATQENLATFCTANGLLVTKA